MDFRGTVGVGVALLVGCGAKVEFESASDGSSSGDVVEEVGEDEVEPESTTSTTGSVPPPPSTSSGPGPGSATTSASSASATVSTTVADTGGGTDGWVELPNGSACDEDNQCQSGHCFIVGVLGGTCGECTSDAHCMGGCSPPNPLADPPQGSVCNAGALGDGCETSSVCEGDLVCGLVFDIPGVITASTCGMCETDADCNLGLCSPQYDVAELGGVNLCVTAGSVLDGGNCDLEGSGDQACDSGHCAAADLMGLAQFGVCSGCEVQADCAGELDCIPPTIDIETGFSPGYCG